MTVPGIGPITALAYVSYVGDVRRFDNAHQVSNFIGFVPKVDNSCTICRADHITKKGNPQLRPAGPSRMGNREIQIYDGKWEMKYPSIVLDELKTFDENALNTENQEIIRIAK